MAPRVKLPRHGWTFAVALLMCAALSPAARAWSPEAPSYGTATQSNLAVTMSDGTVLRANVSFPTDPKTGNPIAPTYYVMACALVSILAISRITDKYRSPLA